MEQSQFKYFAFISYNSRDTRWGKRLQQKLEHYRMPATLCSERGWRRRPINPVFFAPTDIQPGGLSDELQARLRASRHLIVICSPYSAQSEWVGKEIAFFHTLGRTQNIHFFIVKGSPHSGDPRTECFNPVIEELGLSEILGANIHEKIYSNPRLNRERAYVQLISKLLDVEFDMIWKRHRRRMIRQAAAWTVGTIFVVAALIGVWRSGRPTDIQVRLEEISVHNSDLPPLKDAVVTLELNNETKTDTLSSTDEFALFTNIPRSHIGKPVRAMFKCRDFLPVDTTFILGEQVSIPIRRDPFVYGSVRFRLWDDRTGKGLSGMKLKIGPYDVVTDAEGRVSLFVPLEEQKATYHVIAPVALLDDTIYMPCGPNVNLLLE